MLPITGIEGDRVRLSNGQTLCVDTSQGQHLAIRPEMLKFVPTGSGPNVLAGQITEATFLGGSTLYDVNVGGIGLRVSSPDPSRSIGDSVNVHLPARNLLRIAA